MLGYKVIDHIDNEYRSLVMRRINGVKFNVNAWTSPLEGWGPFCVFDNIFAAEKFVVTYGDMALGEVEIWEIEYDKSDSDFVCEVYSAGNKDITTQNFLFTGTQLADRVLLKKMVRHGMKWIN